MRISSFVIAVALAAGCVPKAQLDKVQADYMACQDAGAKDKAELTKLRDENGKLRDDKAKQEARLDALQKKAEAQLAALKDLTADFKPLIDKGVLKIEVVDGRVTLGLASDVLFASGSADLGADGKSTLTEVAKLLAKRAADHDYQVEGHTDDQPIKSKQFPDNWHLGAARALTVVQFLVANGFPADHLSAASFADTRPIAPNTTEEGRTQNRRIEIVLVPELTDLPGYDQLMQEKPSRPRGGGHRGRK